MADKITPGERRELRSIVKGQYKVLRAELRQRQIEMEAEVEEELLERYRGQEQRISDLTAAVNRIFTEAWNRAQAVVEEGLASDPDLQGNLSWQYGGGLGLRAESKTRTQLHRAARNKIPKIIGDASLALDRQEMDLLRELSAGALDSDDAARFLSSIPSVGQLVPVARLEEIVSATDLEAEE